jgi:hypothetical protein
MVLPSRLMKRPLSWRSSILSRRLARSPPLASAAASDAEVEEPLQGLGEILAAEAVVD